MGFALSIEIEIDIDFGIGIEIDIEPPSVPRRPLPISRAGGVIRPEGSESWGLPTVVANP
jgi:hypothetical protein